MEKLHSLSDTRTFAEKVLQHLKDTGVSVIGLYGELGAGKTAFTKELAVSMGVVDTVTSPTFILMKNYETKDVVFPVLTHIDAYRFDTADELSRLGWGEMITDPKRLVVIEWPEKVATIMPPHLAITLTLQDDGSRNVTMTYEKE